MSDDVHIAARQLWDQLSATATTTDLNAWCTPLILPSGGVLVFNDDQTTTLTARVTFKLPCENPPSIISPDTTGNSTVVGFQDPFYASISPQVFVLAATTVLSYVLVILIFITPRTFFVGGSGGGAGFLGRRGRVNGSYGAASIVGIGRRPLLQKIATITVAISLTIATADTFKVAQYQYSQGYIDSGGLVDDVVKSLEIRIIRVISDTFLWLAQVQTLIRLFPRHKEKVTIKWLGFAMVSFDTIFSILDSIVKVPTRTRARSYSDAIPALNYLFELAISLIYASCVMYYSLSKRRFAFYHPKMRNVCLLALVSLVAVLIPVVFFVLDIAKPKVAGWGEYIRWVGAAAASVVVWEWVERIEALERDERKDGILGREVFDGDEMLDLTPSEEANWAGRRNSDDGNEKTTRFGGATARYRKIRARIPFRKRPKAGVEDDNRPSGNAANVMAHGAISTGNQLSIPQPAIIPPSRSDTNSAASTVYAIRYHNLTSPSPAILEEVPNPGPAVPADETPKDGSDSSSESAISPSEKENVPQAREEAGQTASTTRQLWQAMPNPFKRRRAEPPPEVAGAQIASGTRWSPIDRGLNLRERWGVFAAAQTNRFAHRGSIPAASLPVTVIPAPRINERTWSPDEVRRTSDQSNHAAGAGALKPSVRGDDAGDDSSGSNVVVIPAPTPGRTWSPGDATTTPSHEAQGTARSSTSPRIPTSTPPPQQQPPAEQNVLYTPRGTLTISEVQPPSQHPPSSNPARRSTYARPVSISPLSERLGHQHQPPLSPSHGTVSSSVGTRVAPPSPLQGDSRETGERTGQTSL